MLYEIVVPQFTKMLNNLNHILDKAAMYSNSHDYKKALEIALQAEAIKQRSGTANYIAEIYKSMGNKEKAIEYFKKAIERANKEGDDPTLSDTVSWYNQQIKELGGEPVK